MKIEMRRRRLDTENEKSYLDAALTILGSAMMRDTEEVGVCEAVEIK